MVTLYEIERVNYAKLPDMDTGEAQKATEDIVNFLDKFNENEKYFMLLNNDLHYYTLFKYIDLKTPERMANEILDIVLHLGKLKAVEEDDDHIEFWVKNNRDGKCDMYMLFNYDRGVIEV